MQLARWSMLLGVFLAALVSIARSQAVPNRAVGTGRISGVLVSSGDGQPVRGASVQISCAGVQSRSVPTDDDGLFTFDQLPPCQYLLSAAKPTFLRSIYGQRRAGVGLGTRVALTDGQKIPNL